MKRMHSLGLCVTLSLVMVFGSVFSSFTLPNNAFAADTGGTMDGGDSGEDVVWRLQETQRMNKNSR